MWGGTLLGDVYVNVGWDIVGGYLCKCGVGHCWGIFM